MKPHSDEADFIENDASVIGRTAHRIQFDSAIRPRDEWLKDWEKRAILDFYWQHPLDGHRCLTYKMLDADVVAISASSVYRVLKAAGVLDRHNMKPTRKGKGFTNRSVRTNIGTSISRI